VAAGQAVLELGQTGPFLRRLLRAGTLVPPASAEDVHSMQQHAAYFFPPEQAKAFDRLRGDQAPVTLEALTANAPRRSLANCARALRLVGARVALVDVTSADLALGGFHVVRAVSPQLQPLWYGYGLERQVVPRVREFGLAPNAPAIHPIW
jgi:ribosomal protein S12 methylthiotransferase accessory factor YcaO